MTSDQYACRHSSLFQVYVAINFILNCVKRLDVILKFLGVACDTCRGSDFESTKSPSTGIAVQSLLPNGKALSLALRKLRLSLKKYHILVVLWRPVTFNYSNAPTKRDCTCFFLYLFMRFGAL